MLLRAQSIKTMRAADDAQQALVQVRPVQTEISIATIDRLISVASISVSALSIWLYFHGRGHDYHK